MEQLRRLAPGAAQSRMESHVLRGGNDGPGAAMWACRTPHHPSPWSRV